MYVYFFIFTEMKNTGRDKLGYINAVRGLAILLVIVLHAANAVPALPETFRYVCGKGAFGVQLFFVASAFTLFRSYSYRIEKEGGAAARNFFIRRLARISPMYYTAALVYSVICYLKPGYNDGNPLVAWKVLANIFYVNGFIPGAINYIPPGGWSVGVEMAFYCCVPFLFARIKNIKKAAIWFVALGAGTVVLKLLIRYALIRLQIDYHKPESWFLYFWFPNQAAVFMAGIVLFFALQLFSTGSKIKTYTGIAASTIIMVVFAYFKRNIDPYNIIPEHIILAIFFSINIFFLAQHSIKLFDNRVTRFLGEISFSLYLVHFIVIYVLEDYFPFAANPYLHFIELLGLVILTSAVISKLCWRFIEQPGIAAGNKYIKRRAHETPAAQLADQIL
ncbi:MAG TPA: acyltransferase [Chitinophagaceae bacterium]|nr:acyltransferase [Chitinophagaceae bacterium]